MRRIGFGNNFDSKRGRFRISDCFVMRNRGRFRISDCFLVRNNLRRTFISARLFATKHAMILVSLLSAFFFELFQSTMSLVEQLFRRSRSNDLTQEEKVPINQGDTIS